MKIFGRFKNINSPIVTSQQDVDIEEKKPLVENENDSCQTINTECNTSEVTVSEKDLSSDTTNSCEIDNCEETIQSSEIVINDKMPSRLQSQFFTNGVFKNFKMGSIEIDNIVEKKNIIHYCKEINIDDCFNVNGIKDYKVCHLYDNILSDILNVFKASNYKYMFIPLFDVTGESPINFEDDLTINDELVVPYTTIINDGECTDSDYYTWLYISKYDNNTYETCVFDSTKNEFPNCVNLSVIIDLIELNRLDLIHKAKDENACYDDLNANEYLQAAFSNM